MPRERAWLLGTPCHVVSVTPLVSEYGATDKYRKVGVPECSG